MEPVVTRVGPLLPPSCDGRSAERDPLVNVDEVFFDQVLTNLLENIAHHTPETTRVRIGATTDGGHVVLTVEDDGPGVPEDSLPLLFEKFYQSPSGRRRRGRGSGIGLSVARGLAETMGGRMAARRSELGGLAIDCSLPVASPPPDAPDEEAA